MRRPKPTPQQIAEVIALKKQGATKAQIRDRVDVSEENVDAIWRTHLEKHPKDKNTKPGNRGIK